jgi:hypothetical protein
LRQSEREELTRLVMAARPAPFWLDRPDAPAAREPLRGDAACNLAVIGGGFSGLWTALLAKEANPGRCTKLSPRPGSSRLPVYLLAARAAPASRCAMVSRASSGRAI